MKKPVRLSVGDKIGRWTIVSEASPVPYEDKKGIKRDRKYWNCICVCGTSRSVSNNSLAIEKSKSCGCLTKEMSSKKHKRHGMTEKPVWNSWFQMRQRVNNPTNSRYKDYGGRGIKCCERWNSFENFYKDMGDKPTSSHSIDRIDNDGDYEPSNCRWATPREQSANRNCSLKVTYKGESMIMAELSRRCGIPANTLRARILKGWDMERAVSQPVRAKARHYNLPSPNPH